MADPVSVGLGAVLVAAFGAIIEGLKLANTKAALRTSDRLLELQKELLAEEARGYDSDDARVEALLKEIQITVEAAQRELAIAVASKKDA